MAAIAVHHTDTDDRAWDGPANEKRLKADQDADYYRKAYAWSDPDGDPKTKAAYRFIHHFVDADGDIGAASTRACIAGIGVLNGARGGTTIPDTDRKAVHTHLAAHMKDADMEPPELKRFSMERKEFQFKLQNLTEAGEFTGIASTYESVDLGGDFVERGAFAQTIKNNGDEVPILWSHDPRTPVGLGRLTDSDEGLILKGKLDLDTETARDVYSWLKKRIVRGLSIGFEKVKSFTKQGVRHLEEVRLWEVSLVLFPMNPEAMIMSVKNLQRKADFLTTFDAAQTWSASWMMIQSLADSLSTIIWDPDVAAEEKLTQANESIEQFHETYVEWLPKLLALMESRYGKQVAEFERKEGRRLSTATRKAIEEAITALRELLEQDSEVKTLPVTGGAAHRTPAREPGTTVDDESAITMLRDDFGSFVAKHLSPIERAGEN